MKHSESKFEGHGKLQLIFQKWQPATETRAVFAIVWKCGRMAEICGSLREHEQL